LILLIAVGVVAYAPVAKWLAFTSGEHLTYQEATRRGVGLDLPTTATDIRFCQWSLPDRVVAVDFAISEDAFREWAANQGWNPEEIVGSITIWPRACFGDESTEIEVTKGLMYSTAERGASNTFSVDYDRDSGRAYYHFTSATLGHEG
jgi:hypothetical protein